jgi:hypothetical protein
LALWGADRVGERQQRAHPRAVAGPRGGTQPVWA